MDVFFPRRPSGDAHLRLETDLLDDFIEIYGCLPLQNSIRGSSTPRKIRYDDRNELAKYFTAGRGKKFYWSLLPTAINQFATVYPRGMQLLLDDGEE